MSEDKLMTVTLPQNIWATLAEFLEPMYDDGGLPEFVYKDIDVVKKQLKQSFKDRQNV